jgi:predicted nuclease of predicted toxin-antitoxin system
MTLRLLCDENIDREFVVALIPEFETEWVVTNGELEVGWTDDAMLWTYAAQRGYTVLIDDEDFVSGAAADAAEGHPGVVHLAENAPVGDVVRALRRISRFASTGELMGHTLYVPGDWL